MADKKRLGMYIVGGVLVAAIGWFATAPQPAPAREARKSRPHNTTGTARLVDTFTEEDFRAKFSRVTDLPKNAFVPLVVSSRSARSAGMIPNDIPTEFTGAKEQWRYTGTMVEDGVPSALVENAQSGETEFLRVGQAWKNSTVRRITPTSLTLTSATGQVRTFELMLDPVDADGNIIAQVQPLAPAGAPGVLPPGTRLQGGAPGMAGPITGMPGGSAPQIAGPAASAPSIVPSGPDAANDSFDPAGAGGFVPESAGDNAE